VQSRLQSLLWCFLAVSAGGSVAGPSLAHAQPAPADPAPPPAPPPPPPAAQAPAPAAYSQAGTVECGNCHSQVRTGAKFCDSCGTPLSKHCTNCNADLSATARFCAECGTPTGTPPA
jgi:hypothetical protein